MDKIKVSVYVRNKNLSPSGYYRVVQYANKFPCETMIHSIVPDWMFDYSLKIKKNKLLNKVWSIFYYLFILFSTYFAMKKDKKNNVNCVIVSKSFIPRMCPSVFLKYISKFLDNKVLIWDFDDLIFGNTLSHNEAKLLMEKSKVIVVTHEYLKDALPVQYRNKVIIMPTTDGDMKCNNDIRKIRLDSFTKEIKVLWLATAGNLPNLELAIDGLDKAAEKLAKEGKKLTLVVVCNVPFYTKVKYLNIKNVLWSRNEAIQQTYECHIGIMPLKDNEFNRGKGSFKLVQYMATGMPVIASAVGYNKVVVNEKVGFQISIGNNSEEWMNAVCKLGENSEKWSCYSENAYLEWQNKFSYTKNLDKWKEIIGVKQE